MGLTTSCLWGEGGVFPRELGWELKASRLAKAQEEVRMSSQACWQAAPALCPSSPILNVFILLPPPTFPSFLLFVVWGCGVP